MKIDKICMDQFHYRKVALITTFISLIIFADAFSNDIFKLGPYSGLYTQTMGGRTNLGIGLGLEMQIMEQYSFTPKIRFNFPNETTPYSDEKNALLEIDDLKIVVPRFEFGFDLGYTYRIGKQLSPFVCVGMTYGKYETPHAIEYDQWGIPNGEFWIESRFLGIPVSIGNYFELTKNLKLKMNFQTTRIKYSTYIQDMKETEEIHRSFSLGGGINIVYFISKQ
jgi:opacity protein-like surface antigen